MLARNPLHKRNGHRRLPRPGAGSPGDLLRSVHSAPERSPGEDPDARDDLATGEPDAALTAWEERADAGLAAEPALWRALGRTRERLDRGELEDLRLALEALQAQADWAAGVIAHVAEVVRVSDERSPAAPVWGLVDVNALVGRALDLARERSPRLGGAAVRLDPELPRVAGNVRALREVLMSLMVALAEAHAAAGPPGALTLETSRRLGVIRGDSFVRIAMTWDVAVSGAGDEDVRPWPELPSLLDLERASRSVREHGGMLSAASLESGGMRLTLELPAI